MRFGKKTFSELEHINTNGYFFNGIHHQVDVICCSDWKAAACLEGTEHGFIHDLYMSQIRHKIYSEYFPTNSLNVCVTGLNSPSSKYFCRYCFCSKEEMRKIRGTNTAFYP